MKRLHPIDRESAEKSFLRALGVSGVTALPGRIA
jgi:hypothetical protein